MRDTIENIRLVATSCLSYAFGFLMPTKGFVLALAAAFAFNLWAGMRADGAVYPSVNATAVEFDSYEEAQAYVDAHGLEYRKYE